ncbi:MAG: hypothetical protein Kow0079_06960 [Vicingaceae bacterium]
MKIIDTKTGKRLGSTFDLDQKELNKKLKEVDPIKANAKKEINVSEHSPMDPPDAFENKVVENPEEILDGALLELFNEHKDLKEIAKEFEIALIKFQEGKYYITKEINDAFNKFFVYFDEHIIPHNKKEERYLFPVLHQRLIESGEHSVGENPTTSVDLMEDDHVKFIQLASLVFNLLGLGMRLPDPGSRAVTFDLAYHNGKELVELLKLHIFREDNTLFPLAQQLLTQEELTTIKEQLK